MNGGWRHPKNVTKKQRLLGLDNNATVWVGVGAIWEVMPGGHLGYRNGTILAILNLCVTVMPPIKFQLNWT